MDTSDERMHILQMIEDGQITASEGLRLIETLPQETAAETTSPLAEAATPPETRAAGIVPPPEDQSPGPAEKSSPPPNLPHWQRWWLIPMWVGIGITTLGAWLMYLAFARSHTFSAWFWLAALLVFVPGVAVMALAAASRNSKWIHIRVKGSRRGGNISLSLPIPVRLTAWFLRTFGSYIPPLKNTGVDELVMAVGESASPENPLYVEVDEGEEGEKVQVYIG
jgi:hypothetical protein